MGPKKKPQKGNQQGGPVKMTRKEKALAKKIERERWREVARRMEQERLQKEVEAVAKAKEEARIAKETHDAWVKAEEDRLTAERNSMKEFYDWRKAEIIRIEAEAKEASDWKRYLESSRLPHASNEAALNTFLDVMRETFDQELEPLMETLIDIFMVATGAEEICLTREQKGDAEGVAIYRSYMQRLYDLADWRLDQTTAYLLHRSHEYWRDKQQNIFCAKAQNWKLAFWINHPKNPRFRMLDLPEVDVAMNLPKQFALANVAIRLQHRMADPITKSKNSYMAIGGTFVIDVLGIPPPSKIVKNWTLDQVSSTLSSLIRIGYPIPVIGQATPAPGAVLPIGVVFFLPDYIIHLNANPEVGWWDEEEEIWQTDGVTDILYEADSRKVSIQTTKAKTLAVIHNRVRQFPYLSWNIRPISEQGAVMTLVTPLLTFTIEIGIGWCKLLAPVFSECTSFAAEEVPPKVMLKRFSKCGIHLLPSDDDAEHIKATVKDGELERFTCLDMAFAAPAFTIASSKWNISLDKDHCLVRLLEVPDPVAPPTLEKSKVVKTLNYTIKGSALAELSEKADSYSEVLLTEHHASLLLALKGNVLDESLQKVEKGNAAFTECVKDLAYALRLFSFGP
ncbi:cancer susceptibility candidate protein 1 [Marchantia polymorpha subsp. ruderalis]|uniref:IC97/Casc1 N-terminal domain-containing protein n=2 Tax=Marchantia polymorpha TaxID=3197 RepID=A0AAF6BTC8_MARPO|nr:hypothetical protein MARPO_0038s0047 [Marchantia polymorpha]BBN15262.1 hypothetical protein Mp_6g18370 [Marchantia polymorpha subsp. ruderalis]|eukprot:PTQ40696.1 hypothetical protein MARPO_0038s0047 [Marchantia polymorpha]